MHTKKGFTIIEVMIVLAIAGLILAIVFIAVPQLQRNSRDNQRQSMVARVDAELQDYSSNHNGAYPFAGDFNVGDLNSATAYQSCSPPAPGNPDPLTCTEFKRTYLSDVNLKDPSSGNDTAVNIAYDSSSAVPNGLGITTGLIDIAVGAKCGGDKPAFLTQGSAFSKKFAIVITLDRSGTYYCVDNGS